ncbi:MAG: glycerate kinase [Clostridia bacterium]|nr:glycerate kinase [Clostridia bacterium]
MKFVVTIDSFKGSLSSVEAGNAVKEAILRVFNDADVVIKPLADGGEGTTDVLASYNKSLCVDISVCGPLMKPVKSKYYITNDNTAIIEMASASGIELISENERNPLNATSFGVGELISDAINKGCRKFIIGIGGSATNDGGTGMLSALGYEFLDSNNKKIPLGAKGLETLRKINISNINPELKNCEFIVACDVKNPLCGKNGATAVFGPQKGVSGEMIPVLDGWLKNYAEISGCLFESDNSDVAGAGAAGGLGFAFATFLNAKLCSGIDIIIKETNIENEIKDADYVITGEGRLDSQTVMGKAPIGIAQIAKKYGKKVIAFSGCVSDDAEICNDYGIDAFFPILRNITSYNEAMNKQNAYKNLINTAYQVLRLIKTGE